MESITLGQFAGWITLVVGLIGGLSYLIKHLKKWIKTILKDQFELMDEKIESLQNHIDDIDLATCKNFLVARLAEIERGFPLNEIEKERFWEQYEHYKKHGGNSYITSKVEELKKKGLLT